MFNIQLFGDNDTVTSSREGKFNFGFEDGDTRLITVPNPKINLTAEQINDVSQFAVTNNILIGDRAGASTTGIFEAYYEEVTKRQLDLS